MKKRIINIESAHENVCKTNNSDEICSMQLTEFNISEVEYEFFIANNVYTVHDLISWCERNEPIPMRGYNVVKETIAMLRTRGWNGEMLIEELDIISERTYSCIKKEGIKNVDDLIKLSKAEILFIRGLGRKGYEDIIRALDEKGYHLKENMEFNLYRLSDRSPWSLKEIDEKIESVAYEYNNDHHNFFSDEELKTFIEEIKEEEIDSIIQGVQPISYCIWRIVTYYLRSILIERYDEDKLYELEEGLY